MATAAGSAVAPYPPTTAVDIATCRRQHHGIAVPSVVSSRLTSTAIFIQSRPLAPSGRPGRAVDRMARHTAFKAPMPLVPHALLARTLLTRIPHHVKPARNTRCTTPSVLSLFSGVGGLDLGFVQAGFSPIGAFDIWEAAIAVYKQNVSADAHILDLSMNTPRSTRCPDVVIAGSPCQGFSVIGARRFHDPRNALFLRAARLAVEISPQVIVLENVPGILAGTHKQYYDTATQVLRRADYSVHHIDLSARSVGLPQRRRRMFLIGTKSALQLDVQTMPRQMTLGQTIANAEPCANHQPTVLTEHTEAYQIAEMIMPGQKLCDVRGGPSSIHSWDIPQVFGTTTKAQRDLLVAIMRLRRRIRQRPNGDSDPVDESDLRSFVGSGVSRDVAELENKGYIRRFGQRLDLSRRFNGKFRRLILDGLSYTVDTRFGDPRYFLHPTENRGLSAREAARIQGFPDSFVFSGSPAQQFRMIGNAVPVPMGKAIASAVRKAIR